MARKNPRLLLLLVVPLFTFSAVSQAAPADTSNLIPRDVLLGNPEKAMPQLSPDGTMLGYLAPDNEVLNVFARTVGKNDDRVITSDKKRGIRFFAWQYDGQHVVYIQDRDGDENWHLYQTNIKTRSTRDLTPFEGTQARLVAYDVNFPDTVLLGINARDRRLHDVYRLNLKNGALELDTENPGDVTGWAADNDLQVRAATSFTEDGGTRIRVRDSPKASWREFQRWSNDETFGGVFGFSPDNKRLRAISSVDANAARLVEIDIATGKSTVIAEDPDYDVGNILINEKTKAIEAVQFNRARREWKVLDKSVAADFETIKKQRDADFSIASRDLADKTWLVTYNDDDAPVYYYTYDRGRREAAVLFSNRPQLEQYKLAQMKPISFKARDGMTIHGYVTMPVNVSKKAPMIVNVHGGPWARDSWGLNSEVQWLANRGYAVLQINYRGSSGYGKKYLNAADREWAGKMHTDVVDGKRWAIDQGYADPEKVCIYGGSYGGYATLVGVTFTPDEFRCGVDIVGVANLITFLKTIPPYWEPMRGLWYKRVGHLEKDAEFLKERSPLFKADQIKVPLLVAQGANDPRVKKSESDQIVRAMRQKGLEVEYLVYPDEGHGFARPQNRVSFYAAAERFLAKHLGGRAEPVSEAEVKLLATVSVTGTPDQPIVAKE